MIFIHDLETRKQNTQFIVKEAVDFCNIFISDKNTSGIALAIIHLTTTLMATAYLIFTTKIDYLFYLSLLMWILICLLHFYFNGCIIIRIERELLNNKNWYAAWTPFFSIAEKYSKRKISTTFANNIFICFGILMFSMIFLKFLYFY